MMIRHVGKLRRAGAAAVLAAALAVSVTACNSDSDAKKPAKAASESPAGNNDKGDGGKTLPDTSKVIATLKGSDAGIEMVLHSVTRDEGGFVTVSGEIKNASGKRYTTPIQWSGQEQAVAGAGRSFAAMTLVDSKEKKRYYVLRDTDDRPLTTSKYDSSLQADESLPFFAQFPAPPEGTTKVDLQFPGFPNAPIEIS
ncbi:hypothetical protein [Streptomyces colonosanans]|uniref:DUF4352 domain-containing protein n=1 Tax=Streptomyces colonosanans TaxID=1428652 RepID=A0A1S2NVF3_9ACTN|nr:hypothetical protein [Streptomyces colonosanans]OIJ85417.1 hypothetical protein BIV24_28515 [Streptomyces colonosanans]